MKVVLVEKWLMLNDLLSFNIVPCENQNEHRAEGKAIKKIQETYFRDIKKYSFFRVLKSETNFLTIIVINCGKYDEGKFTSIRSISINL